MSLSLGDGPDDNEHGDDYSDDDDVNDDNGDDVDVDVDDSDDNDVDRKDIVALDVSTSLSPILRPQSPDVSLPQTPVTTASVSSNISGDISSDEFVPVIQSVR